MKLKFPISLILLSSFVFSSCGTNDSTKPQGNKNSTVVAFKKCKDKIDDLNSSISESTIVRSEEAEVIHSTKAIRDYGEISEGDYLSQQTYGLFFFDTVYYTLNYHLNINDFSLGETIYSDVTNELDQDTRLFLKQNNLSSKFYLNIDSIENGYQFKIDWVGDGTKRNGSIYFNGVIKLENDDVSSLTLNSFKSDDELFVFSSYYDFVLNKFHQFAIKRGLVEDYDGTPVEEESRPKYIEMFNGIIDQFNNRKYSSSFFPEELIFQVTVSSGVITNNIYNIDFHGYGNINYNDVVNCSYDEKFDIFFDSIISEVDVEPIRTSKNKLNYSSAKPVTFLDEALQYGLDTTKLYISDTGSAIFVFVSREEFCEMCDKVKEAAYAPLFKKAKQLFLKSGQLDLSLEYNDNQILITEYHELSEYISLNTYRSDSVHYQFTDKVEDSTFYFSIRNNEIVDIVTTNLDYIPDDDPVGTQKVDIMLAIDLTERAVVENTVLPRFYEKYGNKYQINIIGNSNYDLMVEKIENAASTGKVTELPNAAMLMSDIIQRFIGQDYTRKYFYNFDSLMNMEQTALTDEQLEIIDSSMLSGGSKYSEEGRWSFPVYSEDIYMLYDNTYFDPTYGQYSKAPTTFDELIDVARDMRSKNSSRDFYPIFISSESQFLLNLMLQYNISPSNQDDKGRFIELLNTIKNYLNERLIGTWHQTEQYAIGKLEEAQSAFIFYQPSRSYVPGNNKNYKDILKIDPEYEGKNYIFSPIPYANNNQVYSRINCVHSLALLKTGNPYATKGAWLFIKEMLSNVLSESFIKKYYTPSVNYSLDDYLEPVDEKEPYYYDVARTSSSIRNNYNQDLDYIIDNSAFNYYLTDLAKGRKTPEAIAEEVFKY